jgi:hypothetical protein
VSPPRDWMQDSQNFHDFMMTEVIANAAGPQLSDVDFSNLQSIIDQSQDLSDLDNIILEANGVIEIDEDITPLQLTNDTFSI